MAGGTPVVKSLNILKPVIDTREQSLKLLHILTSVMGTKIKCHDNYSDFKYIYIYIYIYTHNFFLNFREYALRQVTKEGGMRLMS